MRIGATRSGPALSTAPHTMLDQTVGRLETRPNLSAVARFTGFYASRAQLRPECARGSSLARARSHRQWARPETPREARPTYRFRLPDVGRAENPATHPRVR